MSSMAAVMLLVLVFSSSPVMVMVVKVVKVVVVVEAVARNLCVARLSRPTQQASATYHIAQHRA